LTKIPLISIVDDDEPVREATRGFIMSLGYAAETFSSGEAFLKSDRVRDTACLLTDVQMPGVNGLELQRRLTEQGYPLPIIFITAFPGAKVRAEALAAGALGFLAKPFNDEELVACLDAALARREV
jgi:FixJ family two-component response regulator